MMSMRVRMTIMRTIKQTVKFASMTSVIMVMQARARPIFLFISSVIISSISHVAYTLTKLNPPGTPEFFIMSSIFRFAGICSSGPEKW